MRIALAQINTVVGGLDENCRLILQAAESAAARGCDLLLTPELALTGYPPMDLLHHGHFINEQLRVLRESLAPALPLPALIGFADCDGHEVKLDEQPGSLYNAAAYIADGQVLAVRRKTLLPTYDVFDEWRHFTQAAGNDPLELRLRDGSKLCIGVTICEDIWDDGYANKVVPGLVAAGARLLVNLSSSPFHASKLGTRVRLGRRHVAEHGVPLCYCNLTGAQDELVFDGQSFVLDAQGGLAALAARFTPELLVADIDCSSGAVSSENSPRQGLDLGQGDEFDPAEVFEALCLGVRDYFQKCGFAKAVIGLSGGIDSAVVACIGARALGAENLIGIAMPSRYNAAMSEEDAAVLAHSLGIGYHVMPIEDSVVLAHERYRNTFGEYTEGTTLENLQARERGKILMEVSNDQRALVLSTGNKTEYALGYTTLYGDMCGGLAVIGDVSKPQVYALGRFFNASEGREAIPERTFSRPPSAELREGQVDPFDYSRISPLAELVVEDRLSRAELLARGYSTDEVDRVLRLVRISEYKRWQAPPILRVSAKAFGMGRRMPIVNHYEEK